MWLRLALFICSRTGCDKSDWHGYFAENVEGSKRKNRFPAIIEYRQQAIEDMQFANASFDLVISSLALHYVADFAKICHKIHACLTQQGQFIFSSEHPIFTAHGSQDWCYDSTGAKLHWPVDNYFTEGTRQAEFLGHKVTKYHKTLTTYLTGLLTAGFSIEQLIEPQPADYLLDKIAGMKDELWRPMMLFIDINIGKWLAAAC